MIMTTPTATMRRVLGTKFATLWCIYYVLATVWLLTLVWRLRSALALTRILTTSSWPLSQAAQTAVNPSCSYCVGINTIIICHTSQKYFFWGVTKRHFSFSFDSYYVRMYEVATEGKVRHDTQTNMCNILETRSGLSACTNKLTGAL